MAILIPALTAEAKSKRSGASSMPAAEFAACVQDAVMGRKGGPDNECGLKPESPPCVGLRRALENSQKRTQCLNLQGDVCKAWSHNGQTESQWISIAAGHISNFGICVRKRYGSEENAGLEEALADSALQDFLLRLEDGGKTFRLTGNQVLLHALKGGLFSQLIEASPFAEERTPHELFLIKGAADTPSHLAVNAYEGGSNPATEGESVAKLARDYIAQSTRTIESAPSTVLVTIPTSRKEKTFPSLLPASPPALAPASTSRHPARLENTIFQRVNSAYRRHGDEMLGMEEYLKAYRPAPARDYGDLLKRGGTL